MLELVLAVHSYHVIAYLGYERLALGDRRCFTCLNLVEDEEHALLHCPLYQEIRQIFFEKKIQVHNVNFVQKKMTLKSYVLYLVIQMITYYQAVCKVRRNLLCIQII